MNEESQKFFDALKEIRGILPLNEYLLNLLVEMNGGMDANVQKFLCMYFSLLDDGNARIELDADMFLQTWKKKWDGLILLQESLCGSDESGYDVAGLKEYESGFAQIIKDGIQSFLDGNLKKIAKVVENARNTNDEDLVRIDKPLTLTLENGNFLYLTKHFIAKRDIEMTMGGLFSKENKNADNSKVELYTGSGTFSLNDKQREAVTRGANGESLIVTGGPGTGKTTVVLYILWNLLKHPEKMDYSIYLAAPSGKAADRMRESLMNQLEKIDAQEKKDYEPIYNKLENLESFTIHRLLKFSRSKGAFTFDKENKFPSNSIFVIDEASMIDIGLFASLLQAIPANAHIFILGDPYQLPSVDSGAVLGDIWQSANFTVHLKESHRSKAHPQIGKLAEEIKVVAESGDKSKIIPHDFSLHPALDGTIAQRDEVNFYDLETAAEDDGKYGKQTERIEKVLNEWLNRKTKIGKTEWSFYDLPELASQIVVDGDDSKQMELRNAIWDLSLSRRILSAERRGIQGVEQINRVACSLIRTHWKSKGHSMPGYSKYIPGQLLMITKNQEMFKLYNGDTGIVVFKDNTPYLMLKKDGFVFYQLSLLSSDAIETAFAITIHKSQGSEYDEVTMFLPKQVGHPLLNNQILYTGITRAKSVVEVIATQKTYAAACDPPTRRDTGIEL
ncbi:MAG: AAA family ATPase [Fibrobacter sp.]|uniref:ATP-dependent DNA helicase n=1 Tax=Fibrobacter sp. TaxID=35828 RepID=UPI002A909A76|nr:AAA family ATPase [Fibrobacter sp.]MDY6264751.1 AAA family ATPase [Fibrobacter sp.]